MGQVAFTVPAKGWEVVGGYDPQSDEFFLYVFDLRPSAATITVWSNLIDFDPKDRTNTLRLRMKLRHLGIDAPEGFWPLVERKEGESVRHEWVGGRWRTNGFRETLLKPLPDYLVVEASRTG